MTLTSTARSVNSLRVAVLGSGIAGSTAARTLADRGLDVTVFEAGFGVGGRMSTRKTRDEFEYQFDHGAQYIGNPKTDIFRRTLQQWKSDDWVRAWQGNFYTVDSDGLKEEDRKDRWVGYPTMNAICQNLLNHDNIQVKTQTRADASRDGMIMSGRGSGWQLVHAKTKESLGTFDWLVASDRNSAGYHRKDLASADIKEFTSETRKVKSVKSLTAMVVFEKSLGGMDGIQFGGNDPKYGSLGWAARDSSKPGRERADGRECWVLQSHPDAARELLKGKKNIGEIREMARDELVRDFLSSMPYLISSRDTSTADSDDGLMSTDLPPVVASIGHRWGAAFPISSGELSKVESQVIESKQFVACGDYFGKLSGRIEGGYLSGISAAEQLCNAIDI